MQATSGDLPFDLNGLNFVLTSPDVTETSGGGFCEAFAHSTATNGLSIVAACEFLSATIYLHALHHSKCNGTLSFRFVGTRDELGTEVTSPIAKPRWARTKHQGQSICPEKEGP